MSQTSTELFRGIPSGTLTDRLVSLSLVKDALTSPNLTVERLEKFDPERRIVLFCGAPDGAKVVTRKFKILRFSRDALLL